MAISIEDVYSVADRLFESGQQPTLAAVRSALGPGGHPNCPTYGHPNCSTLAAVI